MLKMLTFSLPPPPPLSFLSTRQAGREEFSVRGHGGHARLPREEKKVCNMRADFCGWAN